MIETTPPSTKLSGLSLCVVQNAALSSELGMPQLIEEFDSLQSDDARSKHVYAAYGLAAYFSQCLEAGLINIAMLEARASRTVCCTIEADEFEASFEKKTLGAMFKRIRTFIQVDDEASAIFAKSLAERNRIAHGFFSRNAEIMMSIKGKRQMVASLSESIGMFRAADLLADCVTQALQKVLGISQARIIEQFEALKAAAESESG